MRVNVYAEEMTDRIEVIEKTTADGTFTGLRIYLELPVSKFKYNVFGKPPGAADHPNHWDSGEIVHLKGPFVHRPGDDDSSAVTFWGKKDLRRVLEKAIEELDRHHARNK